MKHRTLAALASAFALIFVSCTRTAPFTITWHHLGNDIETGVCESMITLSNTSADTLFGNWEVYWNQMSVEPLATEGEQVHLTQIQASYHCLTPTVLFRPLPPACSRSFTLRYKGSIMRRSGAPQGAFVIFRDKADARLTTAGQMPSQPVGRKSSVKPLPVNLTCLYSPDAHEFRRKVAGFPYADGEEVYRQNLRFHALEDLSSDAENMSAAQSGTSSFAISILPEPKSIVYNEGTCDLQKARIYYDPDTSLPPEGYSIIIDSDAIYVYISNMGASLQYADETLARLKRQYKIMPCCVITDYPDTPHRGLMLDIARNFTGKQEIMRIINLLAMYKMNVLHLHLTDDEGWRIEIPGLPELTEVGSRRGYTADERDCLYPMYSGGWNPNDNTASGNGFLTRNDYIEILRYARQHHVSIVPEIDLPGHSRAAIKAMEARYWRYAASDSAKAKEYLLSDFQDTSRYVSAQHYTDNVICIALPSCYTFCQKVIDEMMAMYREAEAPISIFHVGGDEVPRGAWLGSPKVAEYVYALQHPAEAGFTNIRNDQINDQIANDKIVNISILKDSFLEAIAAMLAEYGVQTAGWEEVAYRNGNPNPRFAGKNILTYAWNSVPEWRGDEKPYRLANAGYPVMVCSVCNLYMDMCYLNHEQESGLNWGGYVDEYCSFDLRPDSLYLSVRRTLKGEQRDLEAYVRSDKTALIPDSAKNLRGVQAQLWSETIRNSAQLERYLLPKLLGTAERCWNNRWKGSYEDALNHYNRLLWQYEIPRLHYLGYSFHLSQPGIHAETVAENTGNTTAGDVSSASERQREVYVTMNKAVPGAQIRYTLDGSEPTADSPLYTEPFQTDAALINACCFFLGGQSNTTRLSLKD